MTQPTYDAQHARTLLEHKIRQRRQTYEEFAEYAETFAREHHEHGTLSTRHLQRLAAGRRADGRPLGSLRPATRRLLEHIFGCSVDELLAPPADTTGESTDVDSWHRSADELRAALASTRHIDGEAMHLLAEQIDLTRRLDRRLGAVTLLDSLRHQAHTIEQLARHTVSPALRAKLAAILADACTLAGWQSLDRGELAPAWRHYETATLAAREAASTPLHAHALAEQAIVLIDIGHTGQAVELTGHARSLGEQGGSPLLRCWLAAAHGEALAANGAASESLHAFDTASGLLAAETVDHDGPYLALDTAHLARWRGHALARFGHPDAVTVLSSALAHHDRNFARAETGLRIDLALAHAANGENEVAREHYSHARTMAQSIGSVRQQKRLALLGTPR